ncbi:MAG: MBL fold metallo-hydrolase [Myxococcota bacterium]
MQLTYLGTATLDLRLGHARVLTDPAFDPAGSRYDFGPWYTPKAWFASEKTYATPPAPERVDAILVSHDHHADNLDYAGRRLIAASDAPVVTTLAGARRLARPAPGGRDSRPGEGLGLGARALPLATGKTTSVAGLTITATPARHGPRGTPRIDEVIGFLIEAPGQPTVWISGDTVLHAPLRAALSELRAAGKRIDVAVIHCGAVNFPRLPILGKRLFTFDAAQAIEAIGLLDPGLVVPIHRAGWTHFRQPEAALREAFAAAGLAERTRFLELGETLSL